MDSLASDKLGKSRPRSDSRTDDTRLLPNLSDPEKEGIFRIENIKILKLRDIQAFLSNLIIYRRRIIIYTRIYISVFRKRVSTKLNNAEYPGSS